MTNAGFEKIGQSDKKLYGDRKLLLCGFAPEAQPKFKALLAMIGLQDLPLVWAGTDDGMALVGELMARPAGSGEGVSSDLPRSIIVAGIEEAELHHLISGCRQAGMKQALWATLTPTSQNWSLKALLDELSAEREAMAKRSKA